MIIFREFPKRNFALILAKMIRVDSNFGAFGTKVLPIGSIY